jgi:RimJ/RimL family protein N-acetyltransferase
MSDTELRTARLLLRRVAPHDSGPITQAVNDPRIYRMLARVPPGQTKAQTLAWIAGHDRARAEDTGHVFAITRDGVLAGVTGAQRGAPDLPFEIGYWMVPAFWGQGLCTEAGERLIAWLESRKGAGALISGYFADNPASGRVLRKLAFLPCGRGPVLSAGRGEAAEHVLMVRVG